MEIHLKKNMNVNNKCPKCKNFTLCLTPFPDGIEIYCTNEKNRCDLLLIDNDALDFLAEIER